MPCFAALQSDAAKQGIAVLIVTGGSEMKVNWLKDADAALAEAKANKKSLLVDFSAAPG
jgi:hypothetical protein